MGLIGISHIHLICQWLLSVAMCCCSPSVGMLRNTNQALFCCIHIKVVPFSFAGASRSVLPAPSRRSASSQWRKWELLMSALTLVSTRQCGVRVWGELVPSSDFSSFTLFAFMGGLHCVRVYSYLKVIFLLSCVFIWRVKVCSTGCQ